LWGKCKNINALGSYLHVCMYSMRSLLGTVVAIFVLCVPWFHHEYLFISNIHGFFYWHLLFRIFTDFLLKFIFSNIHGFSIDIYYFEYSLIFLLTFIISNIHGFFLTFIISIIHGFFIVIIISNWRNTSQECFLSLLEKYVSSLPGQKITVNSINIQTKRLCTEKPREITIQCVNFLKFLQAVSSEKHHSLDPSRKHRPGKKTKNYSMKHHLEICDKMLCDVYVHCTVS